MLSSPRANEIQSRILPLNQFDLVRAEDVVAEIWLDILGVNSVAGDDDFFEMGGNSLDSALLLSRIQARFSLSLQTEDFFQARTFRNLCRLLQESKPNSLISNKPIIEVAANRSEFPATSAQSRLWFLDRFISQPEVYNVYRLVRLLGDLDVAVLSAALGTLSRKHEPLRTRLDEYNGEPVQFVEPSISIDVAFSDLSALPESERFPRVKREAEEEARRPFNLQQAPLWSVRLWRIDTEDFFLLVNFHHCITDGVSINQFFAELTEAYQSIRVGSEMDRHRLQIQYGDYAIWEKAWRSQSEFQEHLAYWKQVLTPPPASLDLPFSRPRPKIQTFRGSVVRFEITAAKLAKLDEFAFAEQSTRFMVGLTAFLSVLHRYTGETDLCIGTPVANRRPDTEELIGFFVNTLSLRNRIDGKMTFRDAISAVRKSTLQALAHSGVPFETIVEAVNPVRDTSRQPLFKIAFLYQNQGLLPTNLGPHDMLPISLHNGTSMFDIRFVLEDKLGGGLKAWIEYNTDLFDEIYIDRLAAHFQTLLDAALANPSEQIQHLPLLPETERRKILHEWNRTEGAYPSERKIHELFEETAIRQKNAAAILTSGETWSYERLNGRANQIAHYLIGLGLKPNEFVSVALPRCPEMIAAVLAISKAGGAYVPLDLSSPAERLNHMIQDSNSKWVLTNSDSLTKLEIADEAKLLVLDKLDLRSQPNRNPAKIGTSNDLAYVIYTSGSTGLPKGVLLRHKPVANVLDWVNTTFRVHHTDRLLFVTSLSFDLSVYDIFGILGAGGSLRLASEDELRNPLRLLEILQTEKITLWDSAPALLQQLSHFFDKNKRSGDLRLVLLSGDWIPVSLPQQIRDVFPTSRVVSLGGATEAAIWSNWFSIDEVDSGWVSIPYGKPIRNAHYHILNENLQPQPLGVPGELHIGGEVLADGYLNRQELTAERFIPDPFTDREGSKLYKTGDLARYWPDGNIEFLGRIDHQVKIRGFRVELGEVERALESFPGVAQAVVISKSDLSGGSTLRAYLKLIDSQQRRPSPSSIKEHLSGFLPDYMIPISFTIVENFPQTATGKLDRRNLPEPDWTSTTNELEFVPPADNLERSIQVIWEEVFAIKPIGVTANFFNIGGHSLQAAFLMSRIEDRLKHRLPLEVLFGSPTIRGLANRLRKKLEAERMNSTSEMNSVNIVDSKDQADSELATGYVAPVGDEELALQSIWEEIFDIRPISVHDDFYQLGGDSVQAAVLMSRIETRLGHRLPLEALFESPTIRGLATVLQRNLELGRGVLVPLQTQGSNPPLFLIAGAGGHVFAFHKFSRLLGPEQPTYGMKAIGVDGTEPPLEDIRLIATRYVKEILAERPEGPYVIGGYSVGGVIAFETALQLQAMGKVVSRVIAFDTLAPGYPKPMPMLKRVREHARVFRNMKGKRKLHYLGNRIDQMKKRILFRLNLHRFYAPPIPGMKVVPQERLKHVWGALYKAREAYLPSEHFNGRVILVSSEQTDQWIGHYYDDPHKGWNRWCDEVQLYVVPAEHMLFFRDDNIELLSSQMREILRQVATESRIIKV